MVAMSTAPSRILLLPDPRRGLAPNDAVRRYRLARFRLVERRAEPPPRAPHLSRMHD
jgi:hypothetical protein